MQREVIRTRELKKPPTDVSTTAAYCFVNVRGAETGASNTTLLIVSVAVSLPPATVPFENVQVTKSDVVVPESTPPRVERVPDTSAAVVPPEQDGDEPGSTVVVSFPVTLNVPLYGSAAVPLPFSVTVTFPDSACCHRHAPCLATAVAAAGPMNVKDGLTSNVTATVCGLLLAFSAVIVIFPV